MDPKKTRTEENAGGLPIGEETFQSLSDLRQDKARRHYFGEVRSIHRRPKHCLGHLVRRHWGIENRCHWVLDVTFDEDHCRACKGNAAENLALLWEERIKEVEKLVGQREAQKKSSRAETPGSRKGQRLDDASHFLATSIRRATQ